MAFWATCKIAQPIQPIWQHIFALPWSALKKPSISSIFLESPHQVDIKNVVKCYKHFFGYFNALKTHGAKSMHFMYYGKYTKQDQVLYAGCKNL